MRNDAPRRAWKKPTVKRLEAGAAEDSQGLVTDGLAVS